MLVYEGTKNDFNQRVFNDTIGADIEKVVLEKLGRHTAKSEFRSWENSLPYLDKVLRDSEIPDDAGIAIEYNIPQTGKRVDFIISGYDDNKDSNVVIIELKQWQELKKFDGVDALVETFTGGSNRRVVHPSYQAWSYATLISDYNSVVQDEHIKLHPCACLHNYIRKQEDPLDDNIYSEYLDVAPAFTKGQAKELQQFIKTNIKYGDNKDILYRIENGKIRPSKSLQNSIASMLQGNQEFVMIDDQKVVFEDILRISKQSQNDRKKRTIIVKGGPGTGKSVIAINLLSALTNEDQFVQYVSKNSAPREVYAKKLKGIKKRSDINIMFKGSASYVNVSPNMAHTLIVDEAHRLMKKTIYQKEGENQIKEIISASYCNIFFIDERQRVTMEDIGNVEEIKKWARYCKSEIIEMSLSSQFRCNGSDGYLAWLDNVLEIRNTANYDLNGIDFDFRVFDSPNEVRDLIIEKNNINNCSRMLAGYCWDWNKSEKNNPEYNDIVIDDFGMSWNLGSGEPFAIRDTSINEIGCIHTSQGLEFDYVGVIIGDDIRYENGEIVTDFNKRAKTDQSLKGIKKLFKENPELANAKADEIIKNTYRTLLTRGMKGCYVYCTNPELAQYLKKSIK